MANTPSSAQGVDADVESKVDSENRNRTIAKSYDEACRIWEDISGDHFHTGFYDTSSAFPGSDVRSAQIRLIEAALRFASISEDSMKKPKNILDVGCGIGGSSRYLASKYGAQCKGITLSPVEAERARVLTAAQGLESQVSFEVEDAVNQPFPDGQFDLIWCVDCAENIPEKTKLVREFARVAAPGATIIITTTCHRDLSPFEQDLHPDEKKFLVKLFGVEHTELSPSSDYINALKSLSFLDIKVADWTQHIAPFWPAMQSLMLSWKGIMSFIRNGGLRNLNMKALRPPAIAEGYKKGLLKYCIITARKPE